jgi:hypothetical protein
MTLSARKLGLLALACASLLHPLAAGSEVLARPGARLAQRLNPAPVPGGLPGVAPEAGGAEGCDCRVEVEVPVYEMGRIVRWQREPRLLGRHPQCCRK